MTRTPYLIVVVEDDVVLNTLVSATLTSAGYQTLSCTSRQEAERVIWTALPDLVITDVRMDDVESGWHLVQRMREDEVTKGIPIIICSGAVKFLSEHRKQIQAYNCLFLEKHFVPSRLVGMVKEVLSTTVVASEE